MSDNPLTEPFRKMAGDKASLIANIQATGQILRDFIDFWAQRSAQEVSEITSVSEVTCFDIWEHEEDGYIQIKYEANIEGESYDASIEIYPSGTVKIFMEVFDDEGTKTSEDNDSTEIWVITDPATIAHQVIKFLIEDPEGILSLTAIDFKTPYKELMGELEEKQAAKVATPVEQVPPLVPEEPQAAEPPAREEPTKGGGWSWNLTKR